MFNIWNKMIEESNKIKGLSLKEVTLKTIELLIITIVFLFFLGEISFLLQKVLGYFLTR